LSKGSSQIPTSAVTRNANSSWVNFILLEDFWPQEIFCGTYNIMNLLRKINLWNQPVSAKRKVVFISGLHQAFIGHLKCEDKAGGMAHMVEHLSGKRETLRSNPSTMNK
jgi:hypothetical protein